MPTFVQTLSSLVRGHFDDKKETARVNDVMRKLQEKGAKILDVEVTLGVYNGSHAVYLITYEAVTPIVIEE